MRLSNRSKLGLYNFVLTCLNLFLALGVILFVFEYFKIGSFNYKRLILIVAPLILLFIFYKLGNAIFEYDSNGEALTIRSKGVMPFQKEKNDEFPKYKLESYEFFSLLIYKRLYLKLSSKKKSHIILKYDISFVTKQEIRDLKISLNKIIKNNTENSES